MEMKPMDKGDIPILESPKTAKDLVRWIHINETGHEKGCTLNKSNVVFVNIAVVKCKYCKDILISKCPKCGIQYKKLKPHKWGCPNYGNYNNTKD